MLKRKLKELEKAERDMMNTNTATYDTDKMERYKTSLTLIQAEITKTKAQLSSLGRQQAEELEKARAKAEALRQEMSMLAQTGYSKLTTGIGQLNTAFTQAVRTIALVEAALLRLGVTAVKTGAEFDESMSQVAATLDIEQDLTNTESAFSRLREEAIEYGRITTFTASEVSEALNQLALGGLGVEKSMKTLPQVLTLSKAGSMDLEKAATIVVASMKALELESTEVDTLLDQMAKTAQKSKVNVEQTGEAILKTASAFNLAGQDTATMNAIIGTLGNRFENVADQANTLRTALNRISTYSGELKKLGVDVVDQTTGQMRNFIDIFNDLRVAMEDIEDPTERVSILTKIFGNRGYSYAAYLMQATTGELQALREEIINSDGAAQKMSDTMTDNLASDMVILKSAAESLSISITDKLTPTFRTAAGDATEAVNKLTDEVKNGELGEELEKTGKAIRELLNKAIDSLIKNGPKIIDFLNYIIENADKLLNLMIAIKGASWAKTAVSGLANVAAGIMSTNKALQMANAEGLTFGQTMQLEGAKASVASMAGALTALAAVIGTVIKGFIDMKTAAIDATNGEWDDKEIRQYINGIDEANKKMQESRQEKAKDLEAVTEQRREYLKMAERLIELKDAETLTAKSKQEMLGIINKLNEAIPDLNLYFDETTQALNKQDVEIVKAIDNYQDYLQLIASQSYAEELSTQKVKAQIKLEDIDEQLTEAQKNLSVKKRIIVETLKERGLDLGEQSQYDIRDAFEEYDRTPTRGMGDLKEVKKLYDEYIAAVSAVADLKGHQLDLNAVIDKTDQKIAELSGDIKRLNENDLAKASDELEKAKQTAIEFLEVGDEDSIEALKELLKQYPELLSMLGEEGYDLSAVTQKTEEAAEAEKDYTEKLKAGQTAISNYKSELKDLLGVLDNVNKGTAYSTAQMLELLEKYPQLTDAIHRTADGYTIEADAVRKLTEAKAEDLVQSTKMQLETVQGQLSKLMIKPADMSMDEWTSSRSALFAEYGKLQEQLSAYNEIAGDIMSGRIYSGASGSSSAKASSGGSDTSAEKEAADELLKERKEQAKAEEAELENQYKTEKISAEEYYRGLMDIAERYYADIGELREEYLNAEEKVYQGLKKAQEDEIENAKKLTDQLKAVKEAEDALKNAKTQKVEVFSSAAGFHAESNTAAIDKARAALADKDYSLTETLLKNARYNGQSLADRLRSIGVEQIRDMLPNLSGLSLPSISSGGTTTNNSTRNVTYNGGDINITISGSVDAETMPVLKETVEASVRRVVEQMLDEENAERQTGGI